MCVCVLSSLLNYVLSNLCEIRSKCHATSLYFLAPRAPGTNRIPRGHFSRSHYPPANSWDAPLIEGETPKAKEPCFLSDV